MIAKQNYLAKNARKDGFGDYHRLWYNIGTGYWAGSGLPMFGVDTLTLDQQSILIVEAQSSMYALANASKIFYQDRGQSASVVNLVRNHYVEMPNIVKLNWSIRMYGASPDSVVAISTDWMPDGPDHRLVYYPALQEFRGYGVVDPHCIPKLTPYLEYVNPKH